jgi:peptidoglycan/LPS O-acetylase OafA/YrhL
MATTHPQIHPKYRPDIDGLRAIAVLSVVGFHAFPGWIPGGFIGVDIFFVISGYLISIILFENLAKGTFSFSDFYSRRIRRIFPSLLAVLIACYLVGWFTLVADEFMRLGKHVAGGASFLSNFFLWSESGYFDNSADTKPLLHLWSLGIEEQFYIVWPILLWLTWRRRVNFLTVTILIALISFAINLALVYTAPIAAFYSPLARFWELLIGAVLAYIMLYRKDLASRWSTFNNTISLIGLGLFLAGVTFITKTSLFPGWWALLPTVSGALLIIAGPNTFINQKILSNRIAVWIGIISFPLYLWHWPILSFVRIVEGGLPSVGLRIFSVLLSMVLAWLTYKLIERPIRFGGFGKLKVCLLIFAMSIVGYVGYETYKRNGIELRAFNKINDGVNKALGYDSTRGPRRGECFIDDVDEKTNKFSKLCGVENKPSILIWGDSHAATLYRGFEFYGNNHNFFVSQFTASGCPPILDFYIKNRKECINSNDFVFSEIKRLNPNIVVLAAYWSLYDGGASEQWEQLDENKLITTIQKIKQLGVKDIILIGHLPSFTVNQADMLKRRNLWDKVETTTYRNFKDSAKVYDLKIKEIATKTDVNFISPLDILCKPEGCLISIPGDEINPLSFDYAHLTTQGSQFLVEKFFNESFIKVPK